MAKCLNNNERLILFVKLLEDGCQLTVDIFNELCESYGVESLASRKTFYSYTDYASNIYGNRLLIKKHQHAQMTVELVK